MDTGTRAAAIGVCLLAVTGCTGTSFNDAEAAPAASIRLLSLGQIRECRFVAHVMGESTYPHDADIYLAAINHVRSKAVQQSANAIVVRSYQVRSGGKVGTLAIIIADIYQCDTQDTANQHL